MTYQPCLSIRNLLDHFQYLHRRCVPVRRLHFSPIISLVVELVLEPRHHARVDLNLVRVEFHLFSGEKKKGGKHLNFGPTEVPEVAPGLNYSATWWRHH